MLRTGLLGVVSQGNGCRGTRVGNRVYNLPPVTLTYPRGGDPQPLKSLLDLSDSLIQAGLLAHANIREGGGHLAWKPELAERGMQGLSFGPRRRPRSPGNPSQTLKQAKRD